MKFRLPRASDISRGKRYLQFRRLERSVRFQFEGNVYLFSDPRGGSTWLSEILCHFFPEYEVLWEPLHLGNVSSFSKLGFGWRQYIPEGASWDEAERALRQACEGKVLNEWTTLKTSPERLSLADGLLVKFCRGNALLPWFADRFRFDRKPIFLIRHPIAVVSSQLKQGGWDFAYTGFKLPAGRYCEHYTRHRKFLESLKYKDEALVAGWCLSSLMTLRHPENNRNWFTLSYESLLMRPEACLRKLFECWGESERFEQQFGFAKTKLRSPSSTTVEGSPLVGTPQLAHWNDKLESQQIGRMLAVLQYFGVDEYSSASMPSETLKDIMSL
jgi:hypothetical protein